MPDALLEAEIRTNKSLVRSAVQRSVLAFESPGDGWSRIRPLLMEAAAGIEKVTGFIRLEELDCPDAQEPFVLQGELRRWGAKPGDQCVTSGLRQDVGLLVRPRGLGLKFGRDPAAFLKPFEFRIDLRLVGMPAERH